MSESSILEALNQSQQPQIVNLDKIKQMMQFVKMANNPNAALNQLISSNPQMAQLLQMIQQSGQSPEQLFYALAKQKGVDPEQILAALR